MLPALLVLMSASKAPAQTFTVDDQNFLLNGKPFVIRSGEMHYPRVPRPYWRTRFKMAKAMGLNTICTYVFWNLHEAKQGKFDFADNLDLAEYVKIAQEEGLFIIVRPGPYICTELDFGGFPAWLLKDRTMTVRENDPKFLKHVASYMNAVGAQLKPHLIQNGGNIIMAQVENEYGSYGSDHVYMAAVRDIMIKAGFTCQLFTSDGPGQGMLNGGTLPGIPATVNFGGGAPGAFAELAKFRSKGPRMIGEYWAGWFDHWGKGHTGSNIQNNVKDIQWCLENNVSFNLYMFHGGTNFGFMQGSNGSANDYNVDTTSYDYDGALDESGRVTKKYLAFQEVMWKFDKKTPPPVPAMPAPIRISPTELEPKGSLLANLLQGVTSENPKTFEDLDQAHGMILYRTKVDGQGQATLKFTSVKDYAIIYLNGRLVGKLDRRKQEKQILLNLSGPATLDVLVESMSRINFGRSLATERKGLDGGVTLDGKPLAGWTHIQFPLEKVPSTTKTGYGPKIYSGSLSVSAPGDTFLDMRNFTKGFVWVNGRNLGRYWKIGLQQTLYLPGVWLKKGKNSIVVLDESEGVTRPQVTGLDKPILDEAEIDTSRLHRKAGQTLDLKGVNPVYSGSLKNETAAQTVQLGKRAKGRYLCLQADSNFKGDAFTSLAELYVVDDQGKDLNRTLWKVLYADSEEINGENGSADNVFDLQPTTFWHTQWQSKQPEHPHYLVIDLGVEAEIGAVRFLQRQESPNGRIKDFKLYVRSSPFRF